MFPYPLYLVLLYSSCYSINTRCFKFINARIPNKYKCAGNKLSAISPNKDNLLKKQLEDHSIDTPTDSPPKEKRWHDLVLEEIIKNQNRSTKDNFLYGELDTESSPNYSYLVETGRPNRNYDYRLSPEGRLKIEDRIEYLRRLAHSNPGNIKEQRPNLWIVRSSHGNYCELLEKDEDRIKSLVKRVRSYFTPEQLQILVLKLDVKMPLCEILFEGTMTDLVRIFYARGGTLQFYVVPRFWNHCELLEKEPRLEAKYGRSAAPGLFPRWDEDGMIEEIIDCMDVRPDYSLEFRQPNAWHLLPMLPDHDQELMQAYFQYVHWPTRLKVQKAFENGVEDYRDIIAEEYKQLQRSTRDCIGILDEWMFVL